MVKARSSKKNSKFTRLIIFEENQKINDFKRCKISINNISKTLILTPFNKKDEKVIVLDFGRTMVQHGSTICFLASGSNRNSYILVKIKTCQKVFDILQRQIILQNRQKCLNLMKLANIDENLINSVVNPVALCDKQNEGTAKKGRKRKLEEIVVQKNMAKTKKRQTEKCPKNSNDKIIRPLVTKFRGSKDMGFPGVNIPPLDLYILKKFGYDAIQAKIEKDIKNLSEREIRLLASTIQCPYCYLLKNGPNESIQNH